METVVKGAGNYNPVDYSSQYGVHTATGYGHTSSFIVHPQNS